MPICPRCKCSNIYNARFCGQCGFPLTGETAQETTPPKQNSRPADRKSSSFINSLNNFVGSDSPADLNWKILFTDVFKSHTQEEAEEIFTCGTKNTTPSLSDLNKGWPRPWLYSRVLLLFVVTYTLLWVCVNAFGNSNALPGMIVMGSFAFPLAIMVLFVEVNAWRNVSFYQVVKIFFVGGCASLVATLLLFSLFEVNQLDYVGAFTVGIIEETGKAIIVYVFLKKLSEKMNILSGLVVGAAVGAGFAAFESAGYALQPVINFFQLYGFAVSQGQLLDPKEMLTAINQSIIARGFLAPGGHVAWAAISGAGLVLAAKSHGALSTNALVNGKFLRLFLIAVVLHGLWDCPLADALNSVFPFAGYIALIVLVWIVVLLLINMGLAEVSKASQQE